MIPTVVLFVCRPLRDDEKLPVRQHRDGSHVLPEPVENSTEKKKKKKKKDREGSSSKKVRAHYFVVHFLQWRNCWLIKKYIYMLELSCIAIMTIAMLLFNWVCLSSYNSLCLSLE